MLANFLMGGQWRSELLEALTPLVIGIVVLAAAGAPGLRSLPVGNHNGGAMPLQAEHVLRAISVNHGNAEGFRFSRLHSGLSPAKLFWVRLWADDGQ